MSATYIHTRRKAGFSQLLLRFLAVLYFLALAGSIVYLWMFTQDRFITTSEFRISRQDNSPVASGLALALPGLSDSGSADAQIAIGFVDSADLLLDLEKEFNLVQHYTSPKRPDYVFRMKPDSNLEERLEYYRKRINAHFDASTGMTVVTVDTFDPKLSHEISSKLLEKAESFVNVVNQKIASKQLDFIRTEVERAGRNVEEVNQELISLQNKHNIINPEETITANLKAVQEMKMEVLRAEAEVASLLRDSPNSPRIDAVKSRIRSLNELIDQETAKLSGTERDRLNQILIEYKNLEIKLDLATRLRTGAELSMEKTRTDAIANSRFFTVIQHPYTPEDVGFPKRPYATVTIVVLGFLFFLILRALTHSVFERV